MLIPDSNCQIDPEGGGEQGAGKRRSRPRGDVFAWARYRPRRTRSAISRIRSYAYAKKSS